jgi:hypothetical protein
MPTTSKSLRKNFRFAFREVVSLHLLRRRQDGAAYLPRVARLSFSAVWKNLRRDINALRHKSIRCGSVCKLFHPPT